MKIKEAYDRIGVSEARMPILQYLHNKTGELWLMVTKYGMGGGGVFYERYAENQEIKEILQRCK